MELGRLPELMDRLAGMGTGIAISPVLEEGVSFGGPFLQPRPEVLYVAGWTISYETTRGSFTASGRTVVEAVDAAFANPDAW